jgi:hypothetical protein
VSAPAPTHTEAEQAVLGSILIENAVFPRVATIIVEADFSSAQHRKIWCAVATLADRGEPTDLITTSHELRRIGASCGGTYLASLVDGIPDAQNAAHYARIVREGSRSRAIADSLSAATLEAQEGGSLIEIAGRLSPNLAALAATSDLAAVHSKTLSEFLAETPNPVPSLLGEGLIPRGGTVLLSGEGGVGKSTLAAQLLLSLGAPLEDFLGLRIPGRARTLYIQREGNRDSFRARLAVALGDLDPAFLNVSAPPDSRRISEWTALRAEIERTSAELVAIDTISRFALFDENSSKDWKEKVFLPAEAVAQAMGCAILFLHHWGKPADNRTGRHRTRGTSAMVDDCDSAIRLARGPSPEYRVLEFDKVRSGPEPSPIMLRFDRERASFAIVSEEEAQRLKRESSSSDRRLADYCGKISTALEKEHRDCQKERRPFRGLSGRRLDECGGREAEMKRARLHMVEIGTLLESPGERSGWRLYHLANQENEP